MQDLRKFYIDGAWVDPATANGFEVINPATEAAVAVISLGSAADVDAAVSAASRTFETWGHSTVEDRAALLERLLEIYRRRAEEMAQAMTLEMGTPIRFSRDEQADAGEGQIVAALEALRAHDFETRSPRGGSQVVSEPVGVCGLITPWNWPINQVAAKVLPALAAGCTCILKPSELSPVSARLFAEMLDEAGCPPGVFNLVNGDGAGVGVALTVHPGIDMISFTGSTRAGIAISKAAADTVKRVALELGGKSPCVVFADADVEAAVRFCAESCFSNSGQSCDAPTRLLVEKPVYDAAVAIAAKVAEETDVGDPSTDGDHIGPVVSKAQFDKIQGLIETGVSEARLVAGGPGRPAGVNRGYYVRPTVFADVSNDMTIAREEVFGPVLAVLPFENEADAIRIANDTPYGLAAYVHAGDAGRAQRAARQIRAGTISINGVLHDYDAPFGGFKQSGNGRENGRYGLEDYLELKTISA